MRLEDVAAMERAELEDLYRREGDLEVPTGRFRGGVLCWLAPEDRSSLLLRPSFWLGFDLLSFGVDFDQRRWYFGHPMARLGRFRPTVDRSVFRDAEVVRLTYGESRLPALVREALYDEVKPLSPGLCLGLGGLRTREGAKAQFFFALERVA